MRLPLRDEDRELRDVLLKYNRTELYQICRKAGIPVHPTASVEKMVDCLLGIDVPDARSHAIDEIRYAQMDFLREHRSTLGLQIRCPAQSMERTACFSCVDTQVLSCLLSSGHQDAILRHRKNLNVIQSPPPKEYLPMSNTAIVAIASDVLLKSNLQRRRVAEQLRLTGDGATQEQRAAWFTLPADQQVSLIEAEYTRLGLRAGSAPAAAAAPAAQAPAVTEVSTASLQAAQAAAGGEAAAPVARQPRNTKAKEAAVVSDGASAAAVEALTARVASVENALLRLAEFAEKQTEQIASMSRTLNGLAGLDRKSVV